MQQFDYSMIKNPEFFAQIEWKLIPIISIMRMSVTW